MDISIGKKISVCLLTYNHAEVIKSTLQSILNQTINDYEVIVSDDCSTDGTWENILDCATHDVRIKPIRTPYNMGMANNANFAVKQSSRPYIALLHHDDLYRNDLLEKWASLLERHLNIGFVFNRYDDKTPELTYGKPFKKECLGGKWFFEKILLPNWGCAVRGTAMIRRSNWEEVKGMRPQFNMLADVDLWMRLSRIADVGYVNEPLISVRALRPEHYPDIYTGKKWHWKRLILLYEIHSINRLEYLQMNTILGRLQWWGYRLKLNYETTKWLIYAVVRKKSEMIITSHASVTQYDFWPLRIFRRVLQFFLI